MNVFSFGKAHYYSQNNIGSTTLLTNKDGSDVGEFLYTPFGEMWVEEASTVDISHITRFFTNQQYDKESGLYYYNARYYDPHLGLFITPDPAMQNLNHYAYCSANPIKYKDPTGLTEEEDDDDDDTTTTTTTTNDDYRPTESGDQNKPSIDYSNLPVTPTNPYYDHPKSDLTQNTPTNNNNYRPTETAPLPEPEKKVEPTFFTQGQVDKFIKAHFPNYPKDGKSTSCNFTDLINALSNEFTKANNKAMTEADLGNAVKGINNAGYLKSDASGNQIAKILDSGWKALGMDKGNWINGQDWVISAAAKNGAGLHTIGRIDNVPNSPSKEHYIYKAPNSNFYRDPLNGNILNKPTIAHYEYFYLKK